MIYTWRPKDDVKTEDASLSGEANIYSTPFCDLNAKASSRDPIVQNENKSLRPGKQFEQKFLVDIHNVYLYLDYHRR